MTITQLFPHNCVRYWSDTSAAFKEGVICIKYDSGSAVLCYVQPVAQEMELSRYLHLFTFVKFLSDNLFPVAYLVKVNMSC